MANCLLWGLHMLLWICSLWWCFCSDHSTGAMSREHKGSCGSLDWRNWQETNPNVQSQPLRLIGRPPWRKLNFNDVRSNLFSQFSCILECSYESLSKLNIRAWRFEELIFFFLKHAPKCVSFCISIRQRQEKRKKNYTHRSTRLQELKK